MINIGVYSDALVVLGTAGILVPVFRRWGLNPVLGYLAAGALLGPLGLGSFIHYFSALYWFTIGDAKSIAGIAELGIVFLLFLIGLEMSFQRLMSLRRYVIGLGGLQFIVTTVVITTAALLAGQKPSTAIILGASLSLSSTAIVLETLSVQERLSTGVGRTSFAVLLAQDLTVIPILMFIAIVGSGSRESLLTSLLIAILEAAIALVLIAALGRALLRPLFRLVANAHSREVFIAAVLFVIVGAGVAANQAGLSMALGAFVAGLLLAETEYSKAIQVIVEPFKSLLLGIFFFTMGMNIDFRELTREPVWLGAFVIGLITVKALIVGGSARLFRLPWATAIETGLLLGPGGEFAFVCIGMAGGLGLIDARVSGFVLAGTSITMALTPLLSLVARRLAPVLEAGEAVDPELAAQPPGGAKHAIVVGYGRVGKVVYALLRRHGIPSIATDLDVRTVAQHRREGHDVYYGDTANPEFLKACGLENATGVIITINARDKIDDIVRQVRAVRSDVLIVSRARDAEHARRLYAIGASEVVQETIEASLQLSEAALLGMGVAAESATESIHEKRHELRHELRQGRQIQDRNNSKPAA